MKHAILTTAALVSMVTTALADMSLNEIKAYAGRPDYLAEELVFNRLCNADYTNDFAMRVRASRGMEIPDEVYDSAKFVSWYEAEVLPLAELASLRYEAKTPFGEPVTAVCPEIAQSLQGLAYLSAKSKESWHLEQQRKAEEALRQAKIDAMEAAKIEIVTSTVTEWLNEPISEDEFFAATLENYIDRVCGDVVELSSRPPINIRLPLWNIFDAGDLRDQRREMVLEQHDNTMFLDEVEQYHESVIQSYHDGHINVTEKPDSAMNRQIEKSACRYMGRNSQHELDLVTNYRFGLLNDTLRERLFAAQQEILSR